MGIQVPLFGMVKDDKHRTRAIARTGGEIAIASHRSAFTLVSLIQEEVHRYSIQFSRQKHQKSAMASRLTGCAGIGEKRAAQLMKHFKTMKAMREASLEELSAVPGISKPAAEKLYAFLHQED